MKCQTTMHGGPCDCEARWIVEGKSVKRHRTCDHHARAWRTGVAGEVTVTPLHGTPEDSALQVLRDLFAVRDLGDLIYDIREQEGLGWEGPRVCQWNDVIRRARQLLKDNP